MTQFLNIDWAKSNSKRLLNMRKYGTVNWCPGSGRQHIVHTDETCKNYSYTCAVDCEHWVTQ